MSNRKHDQRWTETNELRDEIQQKKPKSSNLSDSGKTFIVVIFFLAVLIGTIIPAVVCGLPSLFPTMTIAQLFSQSLSCMSNACTIIGLLVAFLPFLLLGVIVLVVNKNFLVKETV